MMRSKTRWTLAGFMALVALAALGAVVAPARADRPENPFAGSWSGPYLSQTEPPLYGTIDSTISDAGVIRGTFNNPIYGSGTVSGHVTADGYLMMIFHRGLSGHWPFQGTAVINDNTLVATYSNLWPESQGGFTEVAILERN